MSARELLYTNDFRFSEVARELSDDEWQRPSLCEGWSNHDVMAHLVVGYRTKVRVITTAIVRHGGSFDQANTALARELARRTNPAELLDEFGRLIDRPRGVGRLFPPRLLLGDHVTHELDIVFALHREPAVAADALVAVLMTQVAVPNPFVPAFRNSRGLRLQATDVNWAHGDTGPLVQGRAADLVSTLGNRPHALSRLHGEGVDLLASRVSSRQIRRVG